MSNTLVLSTRKGLLTYECRGSSWHRTGEAFVGVHVSNAMVDSRTKLWWACLDHGHWGVKLQRSHDQGQTWEEVAAPAMPEGSELKPGEPASVNYLWTLVPGRDEEPERLYLGTVPGGLFTSTDSGMSWKLCEGLWNHPTRENHWFGGGFPAPGIHSIFVDPEHPKHLHVGISCAGMFETTDGGRSWEPRNKGLSATFLPDPATEVGHDPHLIVQCPADRRVMWQQNHCGIFRTADAGSHWQAISVAGSFPHFGFAIACDAEDPLTAWIVPADADERRVAVDRALAVCRTNDGGETWQTFRAGLPQTDCYDFAFRHGLIAEGDRLAFGTACGSLYVSDDRGETWQTVAKDLPPIYAVTWGPGD